jgi:hypothetical protein
MKDTVWRAPDNAEETHLLDSKILVELFKNKDKQECVDSFLQKRQASFRGTIIDDAPSAWETYLTLLGRNGHRTVHDCMPTRIRWNPVERTNL